MDWSMLYETMQRVDLKKWNSWDSSLRQSTLNWDWEMLSKEELWRKGS
jgi:hypothetical protein